MRPVSLALLLSLAAPAAADPPVVPDRLTARPGDLVTFAVKGKDVGYQPAFPPAKCLLVRLHTDDPDTLSFLAQPREAGEYAVVFWTKGETKGAVLTVAAGPGPAPPPDPVTDPLRVKLKAAYDADDMAGPGKEETRRTLVELYRQAAVLARDPAVTTTSELLRRVQAAGATLAKDQLVAVRRAIAAEAGAILADPDAPLTPTTRAAAASLFVRVAAALDW